MVVRFIIDQSGTAIAASHHTLVLAKRMGNEETRVSALDGDAYQQFQDCSNVLVLIEICRRRWTWSLATTTTRRLKTEARCEAESV